MLDIRKNGIRIALSGGGHRASLFSLGAMMYLVDAGVNHRVEAISSVSGGSITNAFIAQECDFSSTTPNEFNLVAGRLFRIITHEGVLFASRLTYLYVSFLLIGLISLLTMCFFNWPNTLSHFSCVIGFVVIGTLALFRGALLEHTLARSFFSRKRLATTLADVGRNVLHAFCATDLVSGTPFYLFAWKTKGFLFSSPHGVAPADKFTVKSAVRASAAFPGAFAPKRVLLTWFQNHLTSRHIDVAYLADGGVWNNLGTQWFEDTYQISRYFKGVPHKDGDILESDAREMKHIEVPRESLSYREYQQGTRTPEGQPIIQAELPGTSAAYTLVMNASSPLDRTSGWLFKIPVLADLAVLTRIVDLLYTNTVVPRVHNTIQREADAIREDTLQFERGSSAVFDTDHPTDQAAVISINDPVGKKANLSYQYGLHLLGLRQESRSSIEPPRDTTILTRAKAMRVFLKSISDEKGWIKRANAAASVPTSLSKIYPGDAAAIVEQGWLLAMEACHVHFGFPLVDYPGAARFGQRLLDAVN